LKNNIEYQGHLKVKVTLCFMLVKRSWPKQHCVWVWSKSID